MRNRELALTRYREHDPLGEFLFTPQGSVAEEDATSRLIAVTKHTEQVEGGKKKSTREKKGAEQLLSLWPDEE